MEPEPNRSKYPETPRRPVVDSYHGVEVVDYYRWLENPDDPEVRNWVDVQDRYTRSILDALPFRKKLEGRLEGLYMDASPDYTALSYRQGRIFGIKNQPPKRHPFLVVTEGLSDQATEQAILDPNTLDPSGRTSIDFYVPSLDGRYVAVCLSKDGSEEGTVHVYEVSRGAPLPDRVPRVNFPTGGGSVSWNSRGTGFYYTRYPSADERPKEDLRFYQQVYFHELGTGAEKNVYAIGEEFPRIAETQLRSSDDGRFVLATVANGDGGEFAHFLLPPDGRWRRVSDFKDLITRAALGKDGNLYLLSRKDAPKGRILRVPLSDPNLANARPIVEQGESSVTAFLPTLNRLYVVTVAGGPSDLSCYDLEGRPLGRVPLEPVSDVNEVVWTGGDSVLFRSESFITPPGWYAFDPEAGTTRRTRMYVKSSADFGDCEVVREFARSKDGTSVPLNIIKRKSTKLDGTSPVLMTGYGGYGLSLTPYFRARRRVWLDQGGIYAVANIRGGGEYGEEWHQSGSLTKKQNAFDDFVACAEHLISRKYTSSGLLAVEGGSNGGILVAACFTQRPELFRAVVSRVGIYDMLRVELDPNGEFNTTEFGTTKDEAQFRALYAYSPYHRVVEGGRYPSVLMPAGEHDGRVNPANTRKMVAALQHASRSGRPALLRWSSSSGHGFGTALDEQVIMDVDVFGFLFSQLPFEGELNL